MIKGAIRFLLSTVLSLSTLLALLTACDWRVLDEQGWTSPAPSAEPETATATALWPLASRQRTNDLFGLVWDASEVAHPIINANRYNHDVYTLVYDGLFALNAQFEPVPKLCKTLITTDNIVFTLTIQDQVTFHDGSPLTVEDVLYSFTVAGGVNSAYKDALNGIASVRGEDTLITITLRSPNPRFAALLTFPIVKKNSIQELFPWPGTGPYHFAQDPDSNRTYLEIYTTWWQHDTLPLGHIELCSIKKLDELPYLMSVGDVSLVVSDPNDFFGIGYHGDFETWEYPTTLLQYVGANRQSPFLNNAKFRQALSTGFDREGLTRQVYQNYADPTVLPIPPSSPCYATNTSLYEYDPQHMTVLLDELGLSDENFDGWLDYAAGRKRQPFELRFLVEEEDAVARRAVAFLCANLQDLGLNAYPVPVPRASFWAAVRAGEYDLYYAEERVPDDFNLQDFTAREAKRIGRANQFPLSAVCGTPQGWMEEMPAIPLTFRRQALLTQRSLISGVQPQYRRIFNNISDWTVKK